MKFAYADPPYIGNGHRYPEKSEVDHAELIGRLERDYPDGWALSCHTPSLRMLLPLCPEKTRIGAWIKPFCIFKPNVNPAYAWEPVLFRGGHKPNRNKDHTRDWHKAVVAQTGFPGSKPESFVYWLIDLLNMEPDDQLDDLFPGTGIVGRVFKAWQQQGVLRLHKQKMTQGSLHYARAVR